MSDGVGITSNPKGFDVKVLKEIIKLRKQGRTSVTSTKPCSTPTGGPWTRLRPSLPPKRRDGVSAA